MKNASKYRALSMPDPRLLQFLSLIAILNVLHLVDHILRGDFHWPIDEQSIGFGFCPAFTDTWLRLIMGQEGCHGITTTEVFSRV
jgi:hypothetical protein